MCQEFSWIGDKPVAKTVLTTGNIRGKGFQQFTVVARGQVE